MSNILLTAVLIAPTTRAALPNPALVPVNALISVSDEDNAVLQNNGTAWVAYSPTGNVGFTSLTGDVSAGPGSGAQAARLLVRTAAPSDVEDTWWCERSGTSPTMTVSIYARIDGVTVTVAQITT